MNHNAGLPETPIVSQIVAHAIGSEVYLSATSTEKDRHVRIQHKLSTEEAVRLIRDLAVALRSASEQAGRQRGFRDGNNEGRRQCIVLTSPFPIYNVGKSQRLDLGDYDELIAKNPNFKWAVYEYEHKSYGGHGYLVALRDDGMLVCHNMGHCSYYGPLEEMYKATIYTSE